MSLLSLLNQLKVAACDARTKELFYRSEADQLEECIRLLQPRSSQRG